MLVITWHSVFLYTYSFTINIKFFSFSLLLPKEKRNFAAEL